MKLTSNALAQLRIQQTESNSLYKPVFYKLTETKDSETFEQLLKTAGITVVDYIYDQIKELVKIRQPEKRFTTESVEFDTNKFIGDQNLDLFGLWVFYPWSNRLVHILEENDFIEVKTSRNQYKITPEERDILATKKVGIVGLSVGQSVSVTMVMERICGEIRLADFDILELTNLNRIRTGIHNLGLPKVYSVAREIAEIDPFIKVVCFRDGLTEENMDGFFTGGGKLDLLVEESDGFDIKMLCRYKARELQVPVIMEASDKCMVDVERFDLEPNRSILHGIMDHLDIAKLKSLKTNEEKIPYMLDILGLESTSPRLRASMMEMQQTISTWPQLASAVTMGGGITADVSRRMLLNQFTESGRYYVDIDHLIGNKIEPAGTENKIQAPHANHLSLTRIKLLSTKIKAEPDSEITEEELHKLVAAACAAPSYANNQPWIWLRLNQRLLLFHNNQQAFFNLDPEANNDYLSLGSAIENLTIEAEALGYQVMESLFPLPQEKELIAVFDFVKVRQTNTTSIELSKFIPIRQTNRKPGSTKKISTDVLSHYKNGLLKDSGVTLNFITDTEKIKELARLIGQCDKMRLLNPYTHAELFNTELKWPESNSEINVGIDVRSLEITASAEMALRVMADPQVASLLTAWNKGAVFGKINSLTVAASSAIGLITIPNLSPVELITGGKAAEKIWLEATKNNLAFQPICLPLTLINSMGDKIGNKTFSKKTRLEIEAINAHLTLLFSELQKNKGVFLFRLFHAEKPLIRSLRKSLAEVYYKS